MARTAHSHAEGPRPVLIVGMPRSGTSLVEQILASHPALSGAGQTRRMLEFLGLPWDDACLRFEQADRITMTDSNRQVRRAMYTSSVGRWTNCEHRPGALFDGLSVAVQ